MAQKVKINGEEYAWEDVQCAPFGRILEGITGVDYTLDRDVKPIYGRGSQPVALTRGKKTPSATMTVNQSELEAFQRSLPRGTDLTDVAPFDWPISYAPASGTKTTDILRGCRFKKVPKKIESDNPQMSVALELAVRRIDYNV